MNFLTKKHRIANLVAVAATAVSVCTVGMEEEAKAVSLTSCSTTTYCYVYFDSITSKTYNITKVGNSFNFNRVTLVNNFFWQQSFSASLLSQALTQESQANAITTGAPIVAYDLVNSGFNVVLFDPKRIDPTASRSDLTILQGQQFAVATEVATTATAVPEPSGIIGGLFASLAAGGVIVARRKLTLSHKPDSSSSSAL